MLFIIYSQHLKISMAEEELMFSMEEVDSLKRPSVSRTVSSGPGSSVDDDEDDFYICPITDDPISPTKGICDYLSGLVHHKQLSNSLPQTSYSFKVTPVFMAVLLIAIQMKYYYY